MVKKEERRKGVHNITKRFVDSLKLPRTDQPNGARYYDDEIRGFGVTIYATGKKTFFVEYGPSGHRRRMVIGIYGQITVALARELAARRLAEVVQGVDPLEVRQEENDAMTFAEFADDYVERMRPRKKHIREDVRYLGEASKAWAGRKLASINVTDIERSFQAKAKEISKCTANRWLASVRACLQDAWRKDLIPQNPAMKVRQFPENPPRERVLTDDELFRVLKAIDALEDPYSRAGLMLLIQTGTRLSEVLNAKWEDVHLDSCVWRIPSPKSGKPQFVPLPGEMVAMLTHLPRWGCYVVAGRQLDKPRRDLKKPWEGVLEKANVKGVHIHDIRRTFGLHVARRAGLHIASKLLRHTDVRVTEKHYAPLGFEELRKAIEDRSADIVEMREKYREKIKAEEAEKKKPRLVVVGKED